MTKPTLLLDSCLPQAAAARLRAEGYDVATVQERGGDPGDAAILAIARVEGRAIVTIDSDFGTLVFRDGAARVGVLRLRQQNPAALVQRAANLLAAHGDALADGAFVTDDGAGVRVSKRG